MQLRPEDFASFFRGVHQCEPFPWQQALVNRLAATDRWPEVLDLPTGSGKTAALDAAVFHLAMCSKTTSKAALRIALVVDRRLVVDDAFARAQKIAKTLRDSVAEEVDCCEVLKEVAHRLLRLAGKDNPPLVAQRLRGGVPLEHDWARTPTQPTILCSTVDQIGSRLLFRGYGVSDRMKPVHAGLLGTNCLVLLDEAHLAEPFRQTLRAVNTIGHADVNVVLLSATPGTNVQSSFTLSEDDRVNTVLSKRLLARKPVTLKPPHRGSTSTSQEPFVREARAMAERLRNRGVQPPAVGVVVNRVALAREIFRELRDGEGSDAVLITGRSRGVDRNVIETSLAPFRTGAPNRLGAKPVFIVATQCLEVGVDLDLDGLVTQAASLDALRQRFGRLNRAGRPFDAEGSIIAISRDIGRKADDPVYGDRIRLTWEALNEVSDGGELDFGVEALPERLKKAELDLDGLSSVRPNAPVVMPAYMDLWSQTWPRPDVDPEVALFLHGTERTASGVSIVWRCDISRIDLEDETRLDVRRVIRLFPPRASEAVEVPLWVARKWLRQPEERIDDFSDAPQREPEPRTEVESQEGSRLAFRWAGHDDPNTGIVVANEVRSGDVLIVPTSYGGCDKYGWEPNSFAPVVDVADGAAKPYWGRRCAVRITRGTVRSRYQWQRVERELISVDVNALELIDRILFALSGRVADEESRTENSSDEIRDSLIALRGAKGPIEIHFPYSDGPSGGVILVAERGVLESELAPAAVPTTEDDTASHSFNKPVGLEDHGSRVARFAKGFAETLGLEQFADDIGLAAYLHDAGKADPRFQTMLAGGDPFNRPDCTPLAKSGRQWSPQAWIRSGLPQGWRHEALSVRLARQHPALNVARDPALVLWLIGSHHGLGRPFYGFADPQPHQPLPCLDVEDWKLPDQESGPQSLAFNFDGLDWPTMFEKLKERYGIWGLAHLEAILRLADHRASEEEVAL